MWSSAELYRRKLSTAALETLLEGGSSGECQTKMILFDTVNQAVLFLWLCVPNGQPLRHRGMLRPTDITQCGLQETLRALSCWPSPLRKELPSSSLTWLGHEETVQHFKTSFTGAVMCFTQFLSWAKCGMTALINTTLPDLFFNVLACSNRAHLYDLLLWWSIWSMINKHSEAIGRLQWTQTDRQTELERGRRQRQSLMHHLRCGSNTVCQLHWIIHHSVNMAGVVAILGRHGRRGTKSFLAGAQKSNWISSKSCNHFSYGTSATFQAGCPGMMTSVTKSITVGVCVHSKPSLIPLLCLLRYKQTRPFTHMRCLT